MLGFGKKDRIIKNLRDQLNEAKSKLAQTTQESTEYKDKLNEYKDMAEQRMKSIEAMQVTIYQHEDHIDNLQRSKEDIRKENAKLREENTKLHEGAGHALHALAAAKNLSNAFAKRLDMLPEWCGLPKTLVESVFQEFDTDLQARRQVAQEIERQSCTLEHEASETGMLVDGDNETRNLTLPEIQGVILKEHPKIRQWLHDLKLTPETEISELGLFTIGVDLGKNVTTNVELWVVPEA